MSAGDDRVVRKKGYVFTSIFIREDIYKLLKMLSEREGMYVYEIVNRCLARCLSQHVEAGEPWA